MMACRLSSEMGYCGCRSFFLDHCRYLPGEPGFPPISCKLSGAQEMNIKAIHDRSRTAMQQFLDILFPSHCPGCQRGGHVLCPSCIAQIQPLPLPICQRCGTPLPPGGLCRNCQSHPLNMSGLRAVSAYQEPLRACIHALKYTGNTRLAEPLGLLLAQAYTRYGIQADIMRLSVCGYLSPCRWGRKQTLLVWRRRGARAASSTVAA